MKRALTWLRANPTKTKKDTIRFLTNWLNRPAPNYQNGRANCKEPIAKPDYLKIEPGSEEYNHLSFVQQEEWEIAQLEARHGR